MFKSIVLSIASFATFFFSGAVTAAAIKTDLSKSTFEWKGSKITGSSHNGTLAIKEAQLDMEGSRITGGKVTIDMTSLVNLDLTDADYNKKLVTHLKSEDFFDVAKFPEATLTIKGGMIQKDGTYKVDGDLKIKSETHPVTFMATVAPDRKSAQTILNIDRTTWAIKYGSGKFFKNLGDKMISDNMELTVKLAFSEELPGNSPAAKPSGKTPKKK
jgi:polyisoprenoid-binding protein YceI